MSVRGIGEGHRSSIGFRTGLVSREGIVEFDPAPTYSVIGHQDQSTLSAAAFRAELRRLRGGGDDADFVLKGLGNRFSVAALEQRLQRLEGQAATRKQAKRIIVLFRKIAERSYAIRFDPERPLSERVLFPAMAAESMGLEDARFVRFIADDG